MSTASYTLYSDKLRISFDVILLAYYVYHDAYCLSIPTTFQTGTMYFQASYYDTNSNNWLEDLEIYFLSTNEYIGNIDITGNEYTQIGEWGNSYTVTSQSPIESDKTLFNPTLGFDQVCFANSCGGTTYGCQNADYRTNEFVGYIDLFGIAVDQPVYYQYSDRLRVYFDVNISTWNYHIQTQATTCLDIPTTYQFAADTYLESAFSDTTTNNLADLEIYFQPTSEYIGSNYGEFSTNQILNWPDSLYHMSSTPIDSGKYPITITPGFNQVCFANNCGGAQGDCTYSFNEFIGYIDLYGISVYPPTESPTFSPTDQPTEQPITISQAIVYTQYDNKLRISFDIILNTWNSRYNNICCITIPKAKSYSTNQQVYEAFIHVIEPNTMISDLEILFNPTEQYIGADYADSFRSQAAGWPENYYQFSTTDIDSDLQSIDLTLGFTEVCFRNNCGGYYECAASSNEFIGAIDLYNITVDTPDYYQYSDRLRVYFDVNISTWNYNSHTNTCIDIPTTYQFADTYFESTLYDTVNFLSDLEIYFQPTSEYIGNDYGGFATSKLLSWPDTFANVITLPINTGLYSINLSPGFNQVCFANSCGGSQGDCSHPFNQFIGYLDLYGISINSPTESPTEPVYDWSAITSSEVTTWRDICTSSSGQYVYAVALFGYIYSSNDYSNTFSLSYESVQQWRAIATTSEGDYAVAAIYDGNIYSYARNSEWYIVIEITNKWTDVSISGNLTDGFIIFLSAHDSYLYQYISNEESTSYADMTKSNWIGITSTIDGLAYAIEKRGYIWKYHLSTWSISYTLKSRWSAISSNYIGIYIYAAATDEKIYLSLDAGDTWTVSYSKVNLWSSISVNDIGIVYASDTLGRIYKSIDGYTWNKVYTSTNLWTSISTSESDIAFAVTYNGNIYSYQNIYTPTRSPTIQSRP